MSAFIRRVMSACAALSLIALPACDFVKKATGGEPEPTKSSIESSRKSERPATVNLVDSTYQREAAVRLHQQKLITIPEVQQKTTEIVALYRSGKTTREEAARQLNVWLDQYISTHPADIEALEARETAKAQALKAPTTPVTLPKQ